MATEITILSGATYTDLAKALRDAAATDTLTITQSGGDVLGGCIDTNGADKTITWVISGGTVAGNHAENGGFAYGKRVEATSVLFDGNTATAAKSSSVGGGAISGSGNTVITAGATFSNNRTTLSVGGAVLIWGTGTFTASVFDRNYSAADGGAIYERYGDIYSYGSTFSGNTAASNGGAIATNPTSRVTLAADGERRSVFTGNIAVDGGAIRANVGTFTVSATDFSGNSASQYGGAIYDNQGTAAIDGAGFDRNVAGKHGGAVYFNGSGSPTISNTDFSGNSASQYGGAVLVGGTVNAALTDNSFRGNVAGYGGAIFIDRKIAGFTLSGGTFSGNTAAADGGALYDYTDSGVTIELTGSRYDRNVAGSNGGAVYVYIGTADISGNTFTGNQAVLGGAAYLIGVTDISGSTFSGNTATSGGAVYHGNRALTVGDRSVFSGNSAADGGALYHAAGALTVSGDVQFSDNTATNGGALYANAGIAISRTRFSGNTAAYGGALYANAGGITVTETRFSGNTGSANGTGDGGGAIFVSTSGGIAVSDNTVFDTNISYYGGAIMARGTTQLTGATFAGNTAWNSGGALYGRQASVSVFGSTFGGNYAANYGGGIGTHTSGYLHCSVAASDKGRSVFSGNTAQYGGALSNDSANTFSVSGTDFTDNIATSGGAVYTQRYLLDASDVTFTGNTAQYGGAVYVNGGSAGIADATAARNQAFTGGVFYLSGGSTTISSGLFTGNTATGTVGGGVFYNNAAMTVTGSTFTGGTVTESGARGGVLYNNSGNANFTDSVLSGNATTDDIGGAIYAKNGTVTLSGTTFGDNTAKHGGAIYNGAEVVITASTSGRRALFTGNEAGSGNGGAIYSTTGQLSVTDADFTGNIASSGSAIFLNTGSAAISNSRFTDNICSGAGAVYAGPNATSLVVSGSTFAGNVNDALRNYTAATVSDSTFATASDRLYSNGSLTLGGVNVLNGGLGGAGTNLVSENAALIFGNTTAIDVAGLTFGGSNALTFNGTGTVNFTSQSLADVTITVSSAVLPAEGASFTIATGITGLTDAVITIDGTTPVNLNGTTEFGGGTYTFTYEDSSLAVSQVVEKFGEVAAAPDGTTSVIIGGTVVTLDHRYDTVEAALAHLDPGGKLIVAGLTFGSGNYRFPGNDEIIIAGGANIAGDN
ncbi:MAG: hypothetical protein MR051_08580, partial [Lentisphaeria bacterium]|nr:hypothetical protein [Lentisphaeria bacterium]